MPSRRDSAPRWRTTSSTPPPGTTRRGWHAYNATVRRSSSTRLPQTSTRASLRRCSRARCTSSPIPGVAEALERLRSLGLELAVVANWDLTLHGLLEEVGLASYFRAIVHAAAKPSPKGLLRALSELQVGATRALHIGDDEVDEAAARG